MATVPTERSSSAISPNSHGRAAPVRVSITWTGSPIIRAQRRAIASASIRREARALRFAPSASCPLGPTISSTAGASPASRIACSRCSSLHFTLYGLPSRLPSGESPPGRIECALTEGTKATIARSDRRGNCARRRRRAIRAICLSETPDPLIDFSQHALDSLISLVGQFGIQRGEGFQIRRFRIGAELFDRTAEAGPYHAQRVEVLLRIAANAARRE